MAMPSITHGNFLWVFCENNFSFYSFKIWRTLEILFALSIIHFAFRRLPSRSLLQCNSWMILMEGNLLWIWIFNEFSWKIFCDLHEGNPTPSLVVFSRPKNPSTFPQTKSVTQALKRMKNALLIICSYTSLTLLSSPSEIYMLALKFSLLTLW